MCIYCNEKVVLFEELGSYVKINKNNEISEFLEFSDDVGNLMCIKIYYCPICGEKLGGVKC